MRKVLGGIKCGLIISTALWAVLSTGVTFASETPTSTGERLDQQFSDLHKQQDFARQQLIAAVRLYNEHMRNEATGQYLDKVNLTEAVQTSESSSIASTGAGLISLTIGDRLGVVENAAEKARVTLTNLLNDDPSKPFKTPRSRSGWYKHFINVNTGAPRKASSEVFSTIDTAILGVGAMMVARYFSDKPANNFEAQRTAKLAQKLVDSISWSQAVRFGEKPGVHQIFRGVEERVENRFYSRLFDEYVILPCIGRAVEAERGYHGAATEFWSQHIQDVSSLPQAKIGEKSVLAVVGKRVPSHFTHQFAYYFCGDLGANADFQSELRELKKADKNWFAEASNNTLPKHWWGLGAGSEIKFDKVTGKIKYSGYGVARIGKNPNGTFSPAIMAGFLGAEQSAATLPGPDLGDNKAHRVGYRAKQSSAIINDLITLHENNECRYHYQDLDFLWRCSSRDTSLRVKAVEGVDFSTYMLGLAWFDDALGPQFFDDYAVKARPAFPAARELRASVNQPLSVRER